MGQLIREICLVSIICSVACNLAPAGAVKSIMRICCSVVLMLLIINPLSEFDFELYANSLARYRELEEQMNLDAENNKQRLNRLVIEDEYRTYIMDKAKENGLELIDVHIGLEWSSQGFWIPCELTLMSHETAGKITDFSRIMVRELGIGEEKIIWQRPN